MSEAPTAETLRIVCTKCLAVARVHWVDVDHESDSVEVWVECHGKAILGRLQNETLHAVSFTGHDVTLRDLSRVKDADRMLEHALESMRRFAERADKLTAFIRSEVSDHDGEALQRYEAAATALMDVVVKARTIV